MAGPDPGFLEQDPDPKTLAHQGGEGKSNLGTSIWSMGAFIGAANPISGLPVSEYRKAKRRWALQEETEERVKTLPSNLIEVEGDKYLRSRGLTEEQIGQLKENRSDHFNNMRVPMPERVAKSGYSGMYNEREFTQPAPVNGVTQPRTYGDNFSYERGIIGEANRFANKELSSFDSETNAEPEDNPYYQAIMPRLNELASLASSPDSPLSEEERQSIKNGLNGYRNIYAAVGKERSDYLYSMRSSAVRSHVEFVEALETAKQVNRDLIAKGEPPIDWDDIIFGEEAKVLREGLLAAGAAAIGAGEPIVDPVTMETTDSSPEAIAEYYGELFHMYGMVGMATAWAHDPGGTLKHKPSIPTMIALPFVIKYLGGGLSKAMMAGVNARIRKNPTGATARLQSRYNSATAKVSDLIPDRVKEVNAALRPRRREPGGVKKGAQAIRDAYEKAGKDGIASLIEKPLPGQLVSYTKREALGNIAMWYLKGELLGIPEIVALPLVRHLKNGIRAIPGLETAVFKRLEEGFSTDEGFANRELLEKAREAAENPQRVNELMSAMLDALKDEVKASDDAKEVWGKDVESIDAKQQELTTEVVIGQDEGRIVEAPDVITDTTDPAPITRSTPEPAAKLPLEITERLDALPTGLMDHVARDLFQTIEKNWTKEVYDAALARHKARGEREVATHQAKPAQVTAERIAKAGEKVGKASFEEWSSDKIRKEISNFEAMADYDGNPIGVRDQFREALSQMRARLGERGEHIPQPKERNPKPVTWEKEGEVSAPEPVDVSSLTKEQIKDRLRKLGLKVSGLKPDLIVRLEAAEKKKAPTRRGAAVIPTWQALQKAIERHKKNPSKNNKRLLDRANRNWKAAGKPEPGKAPSDEERLPDLAPKGELREGDYSIDISLTKTPEEVIVITEENARRDAQINKAETRIEGLESAYRQFDRDPPPGLVNKILDSDLESGTITDLIKAAEDDLFVRDAIIDATGIAEEVQIYPARVKTFNRLKSRYKNLLGPREPLGVLMESISPNGHLIEDSPLFRRVNQQRGMQGLGPHVKRRLSSSQIKEKDVDLEPGGTAMVYTDEGGLTGSGKPKAPEPKMQRTDVADSPKTRAAKAKQKAFEKEEQARRSTEDKTRAKHEKKDLKEIAENETKGWAALKGLTDEQLLQMEKDSPNTVPIEKLNMKQLEALALAVDFKFMDLPKNQRNSEAKLIKLMGKAGRAKNLVSQDIVAGNKARNYFRIMNQSEVSYRQRQTGNLQSMARDAISSGLPMSMVRSILDVIQPSPEKSRFRRSDGEPYQPLGSHLDEYPYENLIDEIEAAKKGEITTTAIAGAVRQPIQVRVAKEIGDVFDGYSRAIEKVKDPAKQVEKANETLERSRSDLSELRDDLAAAGESGPIEGGFTRGLTQWVKKSYYGDMEARRRSKVSNFKRDSLDSVKERIIDTEPSEAVVFAQVIDEVAKQVANIERRVGLTPNTQLNKLIDSVNKQSDGVNQRTVPPKVKAIIKELGPMDEPVRFERLDEISDSLDSRDLTANEIVALRQNIERRRQISAPEQELQDAGVTKPLTAKEIKAANNVKPLNNNIEAIDVGASKPKESINEFARNAHKITPVGRPDVLPEGPAKAKPEPVARTVTRQDKITREDLKSNPDNVYLFGDNLKERGKGGQAEAMRGEPNAIGIPTKKTPSRAVEAYFRDAELEANKAAIDAAFDRIPADKNVVVPTAGLGTGLAQLQKRAPKTFEYLEQKLAELEGKKTEPKSDWEVVTHGDQVHTYDSSLTKEQVMEKHNPGDQLVLPEQEIYEIRRAEEFVPEPEPAAKPKPKPKPEPKPEPAIEARQEAAREALGLKPEPEATPKADDAKLWEKTKRKEEIAEEWAKLKAEREARERSEFEGPLSKAEKDYYDKEDARLDEAYSEGIEAEPTPVPPDLEMSRLSTRGIKPPPMEWGTPEQPGAVHPKDKVRIQAAAQGPRPQPSRAAAEPPRSDREPPAWWKDTEREQEGAQPRTAKASLPTVRVDAPDMTPQLWSLLAGTTRRLQGAKIGLSKREANAYTAGIYEVLKNGRSLLASVGMRLAVGNKIVAEIASTLPDFYAGKGNKKNLDNLHKAIQHYLLKFTVPFSGTDNPASWLNKQQQKSLLKGIAILNQIPGKIRMLGEKEAILGEFSVDHHLKAAILELKGNKGAMESVAAEAIAQINTNVAGIAKGRSIGRSITLDLERRSVSPSFTGTVNTARLAASHLVGREAESLGLPNRVTNREGKIVMVTPKELIYGSEKKNVASAAADPQAFVTELETRLSKAGKKERKLTPKEVKDYVGAKPDGEGEWTVHPDSAVGMFLETLKDYKLLSDKGKKSSALSILEEALPEGVKEMTKEIEQRNKDVLLEHQSDFLNDVWVHPDWHGKMSDTLWFKETAEKYRTSPLGWLFGRLKTSYTVMRAKTNLGNTGSHAINIGLNTGEHPGAIALRVGITIWDTLKYNRNPKKFIEKNPQVGRALKQAKRNRFIKTTFSEVEIAGLIEAGYAPEQVVRALRSMGVPDKVIKGVSKFLDKGPRNIERARKLLYAYEDAWPKAAEFSRHFIALDNAMNKVKSGNHVLLKSSDNAYTKLDRVESKSGVKSWKRGRQTLDANKVDEIMSVAAKLETDFLIPDYNRVPRVIRNARAGVGFGGLNPIMQATSPFLSFGYLMWDAPGKPGILSRTLFGNVISPMFKTNDKMVNLSWDIGELAKGTRKAMMTDQAKRQYQKEKDYYLGIGRRSLRHSMHVGPNPLALFKPSDKTGYIKGYGASSFNAFSQSEIFWSQLAYMGVNMADVVRERWLGSPSIIDQEYQDRGDLDKYTPEFLKSLSKKHRSLLKSSFRLKQRMLVESSQGKGQRPRDVLALAFVTGSPMEEIWYKFRTGTQYNQDLDSPWLSVMTDLGSAILPMGMDSSQLLKTYIGRNYAPKSDLSAFKNLIKQEERTTGRDFSTWEPEEQAKFMVDHTLDAITQVYFREIPITSPSVIDAKTLGSKPKDPHWFQDFYKGFSSSLTRSFDFRIENASTPMEREQAVADRNMFLGLIEGHKERKRNLMFETGKLISGDPGHSDVLGGPVRSKKSIRKESRALKETELEYTKLSREKAASFDKRLDEEKKKRKVK